MEATYISSNQFSVEGYKTEEFSAGRRLKVADSSDGVKYLTVSSSSYSTPNTIVTTKESELSSDMVSVLYGVIAPGTTGSLPDHTHDGSEGSGGYISVSGTSGGVFTFLGLIDTPTTYSGAEGKYLKVTLSGINFTENNCIYVDTSPPDSIGEINDIFIDVSSGNVYKKEQEAGTIIYTDDLCVGGTATATNWYNSTTAPPYAFDDALGTLWHSKSTSYPIYIQYQFISPVKINRLRFYPNASFLARMPKNFTLKGSNTGAFSGEETNIVSYSNQVYAYEWKTFDFENYNSYYYYRIHITGADDSYQNIHEIEMCGVEDWSTGWTLVGTIPGVSSGHEHTTFSGTEVFVAGDATVTGTMYAHVYDSYSPLTIKDGGVTVIQGDGSGAIDFPNGATINSIPVAVGPSTWIGEGSPMGYAYKSEIFETVSGPDDGRAYSTSAFENSNTTVNMGFWWDADFHWVRFSNVSIGDNAVITSAFIRFKAAATSTATSPMNIWAADEDDSVAPISKADLTGRPATLAQTYWSIIGSWTSGNNYDTPDFKSSVQEVVDRIGWEKDNALMIILRTVDAGGYVTWYATDHSEPTYHPKLHVTWTEPINDFGEIDDIYWDKQNNVAYIKEGVNSWKAMSKSFLDLPDTPYTYEEGKYLRSTSSGTEWAAVSGGSSDVQSFLDLMDTPTTFSGAGGKYLYTTSSGIEFMDGIILNAPNDSKWMLKITNSGNLYTEEYLS